MCIDGSNDTGLEKMNPITVKLFDVNRGRVVTRFLDMCLTSGVQAATAESIFNEMDKVLLDNDIEWSNCAGVGVEVDNTRVNVGCNNSIMTRVLQKNPNCTFVGCPCHIAHNTAGKAGRSYTRVTGFDLEQLAVDLFYHFNYSSKRKSYSNEYCIFNDIEYVEVI